MLKRFLKTQALDNLSCCLHTGSRALLYPQWRIQGRGPGASPPPPLNFRPNGSPKGGKSFLGRPPPPMSGSGSGTDPARFWRSHERLCIRSLLSMRGMLLRYSFEPRPKGRVLVTLVLVMTIDQSINGCSYSEKKKTVWRESTRLTSPEVWAAVSVLKGLTRSRGASFSPPNSRRSKRISARGVCCV